MFYWDTLGEGGFKARIRILEKNGGPGSQRIIQEVQIKCVFMGVRQSIVDSPEKGSV